MPEYLSPGVYIQEVDSGPRPIEGVGTACAAFVGFAPAGEANKPVLVTSWSQYVEKFSPDEEGGVRDPHLPDAYLSHAVYGYFLNGGGRCYVTRIVPRASASERSRMKPAAQLPFVVVRKKGAPPAEITLQVEAPTARRSAGASADPSAAGGAAQPDPGKPAAGGAANAGQADPGKPAADGVFVLRVTCGDIKEEYPNVRIGGGGPNDVATMVKQRSTLIAIRLDTQSAAPPAKRAPELGVYVLEAPMTGLPERTGVDDLTGRVPERNGVQGLEVMDDVTMVCFPDLMALYQKKLVDDTTVMSVQKLMYDHCASMGDRVAILDALPGQTPQEALKWRKDLANFDSKYAALYYPWITVSAPSAAGARQAPMEIPPCGHVAGIYARNDSERGVHKAPANEIVKGAIGPAYQITTGEQDTLNPEGINCIRSFTGRGVRVWGARTLSSDPAWRYVNVRRLFNYIEKSIERGTQWVVFEPNDYDLWARVKRDITAFLTTAWRDGMLFGRNPTEAFYVKCDEELNPSESRDQGKLIVEIGLAPVKPAEFVIFRVSQWAGGGA